ncbi:YihY/virulence factor BrkB family protein [Actinoplanes sp. N902-109]|uniref:YihY/virulence factor BrkB family protein n=1 Tax=Actinoplanes sp. (strain N902-109) TaxID=649831 RepID=UPI000329411B|nr:YihY/virulence factor BrkB family protein [Actinoplanes sp. N902-109]AGL19146.1 membrane protein [Actinoplanes sp. N902-109]
MTGQRRVSAVGDFWRRLRARVGWLDQVIRAGVRYDRADGGRLAAAVTYYAFFATFALGLLGVAVFGFMLDNPAVGHAVERYLAQDVPRVNVQALRDARGAIGVIGFVGLPVTGWFWVDALRSSIRRMWELPEYPGSLVTRVLVDLMVLAGMGVLLALSLAVAYATTGAANRLVDAADTGFVLSRWLLKAVGFVVTVGVNTVLAGGVLTGVPRVRMPWRRVLGPAVLVALGLELLKSLGGLYVRLTEANPAYRLVAGSVGLLILLNAINQMLLFAAALTATSTAGRPADLARGGDAAEDTGVARGGDGAEDAGVARGGDAAEDTGGPADLARGGDGDEGGGG